MIYHVVTEADWLHALHTATESSAGFYEAASLKTEGFIHTSQASQVAGVLQRYYKGQEHLLLLHIDETKLTALLKYELAPSVNEEFPHIYGRLNLDSVIKTERL